jgi:tRNA U34 5-methylaminomethyl-2-thiouridine-forming methyltransferase MnmC
MSNLSILITGDGSPTLYSEKYDEIYHSKRGAITESNHVFIKNGIELKKDLETIRVLEVGLGTALNAVLICEYACENKIHIDYTALETEPVDEDTLTQLSNHYKTQNWSPFWEKIVYSEWGITNAFNEFFTITKKELSLFKFVEKVDFFDVILFDAFAPEKQEEMWTEDVFKRCFMLLKNNGLLTTYCSKSYVQKNMKNAGFDVKKVQGPPGKREMLNAWK